MSQPNPPRSPGALNRPVAPPSRRAILRLAVVVALAAAAWAFWFWLNHPPRPWLVRWRVERFLKKQARISDFKTDFQFPSKELMARLPAKSAGQAEPAKSSETGLGFEALREEYFTLKSSALLLERGLQRQSVEQKDLTVKLEELTRQIEGGAASNVSELQSNASELRARLNKLRQDNSSRTELTAKETALAPIVRDLWEYQRGWMSDPQSGESATATGLAKSRNDFALRLRQQFQSANSYTEMYRLIAQEVWVAGRLLEARNPEILRAGITTALDAARHALNDAQNGWVAARICEGYVWPHLDVADDTNRRSTFHPENLLRECADIFQRNNEYNNVVRTYQTYLDRAGTPARKDWARSQIANAYEQAGDIKNAVHYLKQIQDTNDYRWVMRRLPRLEQQLKQR